MEVHETQPLPDIHTGSPTVAKEDVVVPVLSPTLSRANSMQSKPQLKKQQSAKDKLEEINAKLAEVRQQRLQMEHKDKKKSDKKETEKAQQRVQKQRSFFHPKLELVMAEVVYSPYNTKPQEKYSQETFKMHDKLRDARKSYSEGHSVSTEQLPFNVEETKQKFLDDVVNYNVTFTMPDDRLPSAIRRKSMSVAHDRKHSIGGSSINRGRSSMISKLPSINSVSPRDEIGSALSAVRKEFASLTTNETIEEEQSPKPHEHHNKEKHVKIVDDEQKHQEHRQEPLPTIGVLKHQHSHEKIHKVHHGVHFDAAPSAPESSSPKQHAHVSVVAAVAPEPSITSTEQSDSVTSNTDMISNDLEVNAKANTDQTVTDNEVKQDKDELPSVEKDHEETNDYDNDFDDAQNTQSVQPADNQTVGIANDIRNEDEYEQDFADHDTTQNESAVEQAEECNTAMLASTAQAESESAVEIPPQQTTSDPKEYEEDFDG